MNKKAVILLSGGLDSTTTLFWAKNKGFDCTCLIFDYSQRHKKEVESAVQIAKKTKCSFWVIDFRLPWGGSALTDLEIKVPKDRELSRISEDIPLTYVPARNTIFLSFAVSCAEAIGAQKIFLGANALDYSGYPDCRPEYFEQFNRLIETGTKTGTEGRIIQIQAPLIHKTKKEIVKLAVELKVPLELTWSCYEGKQTPCKKCDSCILRRKGFEEAGVVDPLVG